MSRWFSLILFLAWGCATAPRPPAAALTPRKPDTSTVRDRDLVDPTDPERMFHLAADAERQGKLVEAHRLYVVLMQREPDPAGEWLLPSHFNRGLLFEKTRSYAAALEQYEAILATDDAAKIAHPKTFLHAHYRAAACAGELSRWIRVAELMDALLGRSDVTGLDRIEAWVGRGIAAQSLNDLEIAETAFARALGEIRRMARAQRFDDQGFEAEAAFRLGEILRTRYEKIALAFPLESLRIQLRDKCRLLLEAQSRYLRAMRAGDAHTVAAAGFRIGHLYESLYDMLTGLPVPQELDGLAREAYQIEVRDRLQILVKKALRVYERARQVGIRMTSASTWIQKLDASIARLQDAFLGTESMSSHAQLTTETSP